MKKMLLWCPKIACDVLLSHYSQIVSLHRTMFYTLIFAAEIERLNNETELFRVTFTQLGITAVVMKTPGLLKCHRAV